MVSTPQGNTANLPFGTPLHPPVPGGVIDQEAEYWLDVDGDQIQDVDGNPIEVV